MLIGAHNSINLAVSQPKRQKGPHKVSGVKPNAVKNTAEALQVSQQRAKSKKVIVPELQTKSAELKRTIAEKRQAYLEKMGELKKQRKAAVGEEAIKKAAKNINALRKTDGKELKALKGERNSVKARLDALTGKKPENKSKISKSMTSAKNAVKDAYARLKTVSLNNKKAGMIALGVGATAGVVAGTTVAVQKVESKKAEKQSLSTEA